MSLTVDQQALPLYESIEHDTDFFYGSELFQSQARGLCIQCDKYRDWHVMDVLPNGAVDVIEYSHDGEAAKSIGRIGPKRFRLFHDRVEVTMKTRFTMSKASGPLCIYSDFEYRGNQYLWRIKYSANHDTEHLEHCSLLRNDRLVAFFNPMPFVLESGCRALGQLFMKCYSAEWPVMPVKVGEKLRSEIGYHEKDADVDVMLVSFVAVWLRILREQMSRPHEYLMSM